MGTSERRTSRTSDRSASKAQQDSDISKRITFSKTLQFSDDEDEDDAREAVHGSKEASQYLDAFSDADEEEDDIDCESKQDRRLQRALLRDGSMRSPRDLAVILEALHLMDDKFIMNLDDAVKQALCSRFTLEEFDAGERIFDYGEYGDKLYLIWSGRVSLEVPRNHEVIHKQNVAPERVGLIPFSRLDRGRAFGELALVSDNRTRSARVTAAKKTMLMVLTADDYQWGVGMAQGSFVKERVNFLRSVDRSVLEDVAEVDLRAMAGHLRLESHVGDRTILKQGAEADHIIFVKSGFCKVTRQLHPRFNKAYDDYSEKGLPPPNPFADDVEESALVSLPECEHTASTESVEEALVLDFGLGSRKILKNLMSTYSDDVDDSAKAAMSRRITTMTTQGARGKSMIGGNVISQADEVSDSSEKVVVVDILRAGTSFGVMEMMEGFAYQSSVVSNPVAEVYVMTKYDLIRNTSKVILHKLFCDYKVRLSDERLVQRLKQKHRWNEYKRDLWDQIQSKKKSCMFQYGVDRRSVSRRIGSSDLSGEEYERVGAGEILWDRRAQTPPKPSNQHKHVQEYVFHVHCFRNPGANTPEVVVEHDAHDASLAELDQKILMTIATSRFRDHFRRDFEQADSGPEQIEEEYVHAGEKKKAKQTNAHRENKVKRAQELEELVQSAAAAYLDTRRTHIRELQQAGKARASIAAKKQARATPRLPPLPARSTSSMPTPRK